MSEWLLGDRVPADNTQGWTLPLEIGRDGLIPDDRGRRLCERARLVLEVAPGERPLLPAFGCRVHQLAGVDGDEQRQLAAALIEEALERWLPQFSVERVDVLGVEGNRVNIALIAEGHRQELAFEYRGSAAEGRRGGDA